jgi:A/G-specific adenine glycosylase
VRAALLDWYARHRRPLPWRDAADPYAVWVSEVMLQQTRVDTVLPYYQRWMAALPTVADLAAAELEDVLRLWQGLGYYARARHLHRAAREVMARHGGRLPDNAAALEALPGLGPYAAGAVASIAFGEAVPAVDGNVTRVISRLAALDGEPGTSVTRAAVSAVAERLVPGVAPGDVNQALMELGATVCTPTAPACPLCPMTGWCTAFAEGRQQALPRRRPRRRPRPEHWYAFVVSSRDGDAVLVARRPAAGLLGGLWEFPMLVADKAVDPMALAHQSFGLTLAEARCLPAVAHVFTHIRLVATPVAAVLIGEVVGLPGYDAWRWATAADLAGLPTSALMTKLARVAGPGAGRAGPASRKHKAAGPGPTASE